MEKKYEKVCYDTNFGYCIHHTTGMSAEESTLGYLHYPTEFMFYYFIHGSGIVKIDGNHYDIGEGDIVMLTPSELFYCSIEKNKPHERIVLHVNETIMKNFSTDCSFLFMPFYKNERGVGNRIPAQIVKEFGLDKSFESLLNIVRNPDRTSSTLAICKTIEVLAQVGKILDSKELHDSGHMCENPLVNEVLNFLNNHFREDISISGIASTFNVDKSYLSHLFKEHMGVSLWNYVIFRRIYLFNSLIKKGHSIEETSRQVGFQNYSNFFRLYKKHMQMTPTQFKKKVNPEI